MVQPNAAVTFNGYSNVMTANCKDSSKCSFGGKNIYSESINIEFAVCKPGTASPGILSGNLDIDFDGCLIELCTWHAETNKGVAASTTGTHLVPAAGCKMSKRIDVHGDMTINGNNWISPNSVVSATCTKDNSFGSEPGLCETDEQSNAKKIFSSQAIHFRAASEGTKSYTYIYDLGASYNINEVMLEGSSTGHWSENGKLGGSYAQNDNRFSITLSNYSKVWSDSGFTITDECSMLNDGCGFKFSTRTIRYIKLKVDSHCKGCVNNDYVTDIKVGLGGLRQLQSNRVDNQGATANGAHRHFELHSGKLTLNYLRLTWGQIDSGGSGGFIYMWSGTLAINWVHFDGTETSGSHASSGGSIYVQDGTVTIKKSTFEGFSAKYGGALYVEKTSTAMTIESTSFIDNEATVRFIYRLALI